MLGSTHILVGVAALTAAEVATRSVIGQPLIQPHLIRGGLPAGATFCLGAAVIGALVPDLDAEDSTIHRELGLLSWPVKIGLALLGVKHRGLLHSGLAMFLVAMAAVTTGWRLGYWDVGLAFALGYISHVALADAMTISGVPLLWPLGRRFHLLPRPLRVRTGGPAEKLVALLVVMGLVWLLPQVIPPEWIDLMQRLR